LLNLACVKSTKQYYVFGYELLHFSHDGKIRDMLMVVYNEIAFVILTQKRPLPIMLISLPDIPLIGKY
jgi:hypothetical protein